MATRLEENNNGWGFGLTRHPHPSSQPEEAPGTMATITGLLHHAAGKEPQGNTTAAGGEQDRHAQSGLSRIEAAEDGQELFDRQRP